MSELDEWYRENNDYGFSIVRIASNEGVALYKVSEPYITVDYARRFRPINYHIFDHGQSVLSRSDYMEARDEYNKYLGYKALA